MEVDFLQTRDVRDRCTPADIEEYLWRLQHLLIHSQALGCFESRVALDQRQIRSLLQPLAQ